MALALHVISLGIGSDSRPSQRGADPDANVPGLWFGRSADSAGESASLLRMLHTWHIRLFRAEIKDELEH
jgi:hypothetical protein